MRIFESEICKYLIKWTGVPGAWRKNLRAIPEIFDDKEQLVGKLDLTGKMYKKLLMTDPTDSTILTASKKTWRLARTYEIKDNQNNLVGTVKPSTVFKHENLAFYNPDKKEILRTIFVGEKKGDYQSGLEAKDFEINQPDGKKIAKVSVKSNQEDRWLIEIFDSSFNRKIILCLMMGMFSSAFDSMPSG